jgi:DNA-binding FadR family transcriptional regulator
MANQFYVQPAGDMSQGLQGLGAALRYSSEQRKEQEAAEAKRAAETEAQSALYDAYQSGDPNLMAEAAIKYPQISQQISAAYGLQQDYQKQEATDFATEVLANPNRAMEIAEKRVAMLTPQKRDPAHTMEFIESYQQDPQGALKALELSLAGINPDAHKAYREMAETKVADAIKGIEVDGSIINPVDGTVIYQGQPKEQEAFEVLSPQQAQQMGLPATGSFKRNKTTGEVSAIGGAQTVINNNANQATEGERTAGILANRLDFAQSQINDVLAQTPEAQSPGALSTMLEGAGMDYLARVSKPADRQIIEAAQDDMLDAALTLGTGAAYTAEQLKGYRRSYFPQLGDDQKTIEAKASRLKNLLDAAYTKAGRGAPSVMRSAGGLVAPTNQPPIQGGIVPPNSGGSTMRRRYNPATGMIE